MPWPRDLENPMAQGDYYEVSPPMEDTEERRMAYIAEKGIGWKVAGYGLETEPFSREALRDTLDDAWKLFCQSLPETAREWAAGYLAEGIAHALYREWLEEPRLQIKEG